MLGGIRYQCRKQALEVGLWYLVAANNLGSGPIHSLAPFMRPEVKRGLLSKNRLGLLPLHVGIAVSVALEFSVSTPQSTQQQPTQL